MLRPSRNSFRLAEEPLDAAGDRAEPFTTARLSRVGLEPNLSRMLEQERKMSALSTTPPRLMEVLARR